MSADNRFGGVMRIPASGAASQFEAELDATRQAFREYGFRIPNDVTQSSFVAGVAGAFMSSEMPLADMLPDVSPQTQQYFGREVRPRLAVDAERGDARALALAHQAGRLASAYILIDPDAMSESASFRMGNVSAGKGCMRVDGLNQNYDIQTGWVVDFGMGLAGLFNHLKSVRAGTYGVIAMQKTQGERAALEGVAAHRKVPSERLQVFADGIQVNAEALIENNDPNIIDVVIASRVHEAGADLEAGLNLVSQLLRSGGILVARGPRRFDFEGGIGYDKLLRMAKKDPALTIIANSQYMRASPRGAEANRVFIARAR